MKVVDEMLAAVETTVEAVESVAEERTLNSRAALRAAWADWTY